MSQLAALGFRCSSPLSVAAPSLRCSTGPYRLLHRFLQVQHPVSTAPQVLAGAAPSLHCSTGSCRCSTRSSLLHRFLQVQHSVSTAPQVLASAAPSLPFSTGSCRCSTQSSLLHRFLQVQHPVSTAPQVLAGAAPSLHCSTGNCRLPRSTSSPLLHRGGNFSTGSSSTRSQLQFFYSLWVFPFLKHYLFKVCDASYYMYSMKDGYNLKLFKQKTLILIFFLNTTVRTRCFYI